jgi:hypothetical protein
MTWERRLTGDRPNSPPAASSSRARSRAGAPQSTSSSRTWHNDCIPCGLLHGIGLDGLVRWCRFSSDFTDERGGVGLVTQPSSPASGAFRNRHLALADLRPAPDAGEGDRTLLSPRPPRAHRHQAIALVCVGEGIPDLREPPHPSCHYSLLPLPALRLSLDVGVLEILAEV